MFYSMATAMIATKDFIHIYLLLYLGQNENFIGEGDIGYKFPSSIIDLIGFEPDFFCPKGWLNCLKTKDIKQLFFTRKLLRIELISIVTRAKMRQIRNLI